MSPRCCAPGGRLNLVPHPRSVTVRVSGWVLAASRRVLRVEEASQPPVFYFPPEDVRLDLLASTEVRTRCPLKGEARLLDLRLPGRRVPGVAWSYPDPCPSVASLRGLIAFQANRVDSIEEGGVLASSR